MKYITGPFLNYGYADPPPPLPSVFLRFYWKMRYVMNRKKNHVSDFSDIYFSSYGQFWSFLHPNHPNFRWIFTITRKINRKNRKINFSFDSAHCASFMKIGSKLRGGRGGLHILSWDRALLLIIRMNFIVVINLNDGKQIVKSRSVIFRLGEFITDYIGQVLIT